MKQAKLAARQGDTVAKQRRIHQHHNQQLIESRESWARNYFSLTNDTSAKKKVPTLNRACFTERDWAWQEKSKFVYLKCSASSHLSPSLSDFSQIKTLPFSPPEASMAPPLNLRQVKKKGKGGEKGHTSTQITALHLL